jgi:hypothetical protein
VFGCVGVKAHRAASRGTLFIDRFVRDRCICAMPLAKTHVSELFRQLSVEKAPPERTGPRAYVAMLQLFGGLRATRAGSRLGKLTYLFPR